MAREVLTHSKQGILGMPSLVVSLKLSKYWKGGLPFLELLDTITGFVTVNYRRGKRFKGDPFFVLGDDFQNIKGVAANNF